jgi:hypothetical protein
VATATRLLNERRSQISFRDLFAAVQALRATDDNHCRACLTPIVETAESPLERAKSGVRELAELATLEADHQRRSWVHKEASESLLAELHTLEEFLETSGQRDSAVFACLRALPNNPDASDWWMSVHSSGTDETGGTPTLACFRIWSICQRAWPSVFAA